MGKPNKNAGKASPRTNVALPPEEQKDSKKTQSRWTFLTNHSHVLILLYRNPSMVLREVALQIGITERAVQRIIADLEQEGFIKREKVGRQNHYRILSENHLRHPVEQHRTIGDVLAVICKD